MRLLRAPALAQLQRLARTLAAPCCCCTAEAARGIMQHGGGAGAVAGGAAVRPRLCAAALRSAAQQLSGRAAWTSGVQGFASGVQGFARQQLSGRARRQLAGALGGAGGAGEQADGPPDEATGEPLCAAWRRGEWGSRGGERGSARVAAARWPAHARARVHAPYGLQRTPQSGASGPQPRRQAQPSGPKLRAALQQPPAARPPAPRPAQHQARQPTRSWTCTVGPCWDGAGAHAWAGLGSQATPCAPSVLAATSLLRTLHAQGTCRPRAGPCGARAGGWCSAICTWRSARWARA